MSSRRAWALAVPLTGILSACAFTGSAAAATQSFGCRASVARVSLLSGALPAVEPYVANPDGTPCITDSAGLSSGGELNLGGISLGGGLGLPLGSSGSITLGPAAADTDSVADDTGMSASALASVNAASIPTPAGAITVAGPAQATAAYACVNGAVQASAGSTLDAIQIGGRNISLPGGVPDTIPLTLPGALGSLLPGATIGSVAVNQNTVTATTDTEQLLDVTINGATSVVLGEATVSQPAGNACAGVPGDPTGPTNPATPTNPTNPTTPTGGGSPAGSVCPSGTTLLASTGLCEIVTSSTGSGVTGIAVAAPSSNEIIGGTVISLAEARKRYGAKTACLNGAGPRFVVVGTRKADHITVARVRMRVLGLAGNDAITVKGGNRTCVNGGAGNDTLTSKQKNYVTVFGANGNDRITLGNGPAYVLAGNGNDHVVAGNGAVNLQGNRGKDSLKAGNGRDILGGGSGNDTLVAGTGRDHLNGGPGDNRLTARGKTVYVKAGKGHSTAYVTRANRGYARHHGIATVHVIG